MARQVTVHTYNILSSKLCNPESYPFVKTSFIQANYRFQQILKKLKTQSIANNAIICLQEVPREWAGPFHVFFAKENYTFIRSHYGKPFNGYMGIAIAFPRTYQLDDCTITRVSDTKAWIEPPAAPVPWIRKLFSPLQSVVQLLSRYWRTSIRGLPAIEPPLDAYSYAKYRENTLIFGKFSFKKNEQQDQTKAQPNKNQASQFCVATYHMPCAYWAPEVMLIHTGLSAQLVQNLAGDLPVVFAGDFNFQPNSNCYDLITKGVVSKEDPHYPKREYDPWEPKLRYGFNSAYGQFLGSEPAFTNYSKSFRSEFIGTLDYLFASEQFITQSVVEIPQNAGFIPSEFEPSDHFLIGATFLLRE